MSARSRSQTTLCYQLCRYPPPPPPQHRRMNPNGAEKQTHLTPHFGTCRRYFSHVTRRTSRPAALGAREVTVTTDGSSAPREEIAKDMCPIPHSVAAYVRK